MILIIVAFIVFMIFVGVPLLIFLFETLLIIPLLLLIGAAGRILFRRPWTIEAIRTDLPDALIAWNVVGWRASSRAADRMASQIAASGTPSPEPPPDVVGPRAHRRLKR